jgi:endonuclease/exonuclease/phosphatase family metal-dependent hydrolase
VTISILTLNIYNHEDFDSRLAAIIETLRMHDADIVCLQEVPPGRGTTEAVAQAAGYGYWSECVFERPDDGWTEALAVMSRGRQSGSEPIELRPGALNCLRVALDVDRRRLDVYNTHLHPRDSELRQREASSIIEAVGREPSVPSAVCGDFNAVPEGKTMAVVWPHLRSAFEMANGRHPETTFPTPLRPLAGRRPGFSERREAPPTDDESEARAAIDYILVRPEQFRASRAVVIGDRVGDVWPSDHYGLAAELEPA